jgi:hypothetical protein
MTQVLFRRYGQRRDCQQGRPYIDEQDAFVLFQGFLL